MIYQQKKIILKAINISSPSLKSIILFITSSGCARTETLNLTIQDFINSTNLYHNSDNIKDTIEELRKQDDVIPTWKIKRQKTNKYYITFSSPESTQAIIDYLISTNRNLTNKDKLFKYNSFYFTRAFQDINEKLNLGKASTFNRFRSHNLRKFHASQLYNDGMAMEYVDSLQGRSKGKTQSSYFMENPEKLKEIYKEHMHSILINTEVNRLDVKSREYKELEKETDYYKDLVENRLKALENSQRTNENFHNPSIYYGTKNEKL